MTKKMTITGWTFVAGLLIIMSRQPKTFVDFTTSIYNIHQNLLVKSYPTYGTADP